MLERRIPAFIAGGLLIAVSLILAWLRLDRGLMDAIYGRPPALLGVVRILTLFGSLWVLIPASVLAILFAAHHHGRRMAWRIGIGMAAAEGVTELLKLVLSRTRPDVLHQVSASGSSYPSGHALNSIVIWVLIALMLVRLEGMRGTARFLFAIPLVVGWSRVYLGVHWPSDVLAGWGIGLVLVALIAGSKPKGVEPGPAA